MQGNHRDTDDTAGNNFFIGHQILPNEEKPVPWTGFLKKSLSADFLYWLLDRIARRAEFFCPISEYRSGKKIVNSLSSLRLCGRCQNNEYGPGGGKTRKDKTRVIGFGRDAHRLRAESRTGAGKKWLSISVISIPVFGRLDSFRRSTCFEASGLTDSSWNSGRPSACYSG